jgi:hypothetical protein
MPTMRRSWFGESPARLRGAERKFACAKFFSLLLAMVAD